MTAAMWARELNPSGAFVGLSSYDGHRRCSAMLLRKRLSSPCCTRLSQRSHLRTVRCHGPTLGRGAPKPQLANHGPEKMCRPHRIDRIYRRICTALSSPKNCMLSCTLDNFSTISIDRSDPQPQSHPNCVLRHMSKGQPSC
jgi:hypothetical protein